MYYLPSAKVLLKKWAQNYGTKLGPIGASINEPADTIAKQQANMQQLVTDITNVELARLELQRLEGIMNNTVTTVNGETREYVKRLKTNPLFTEMYGDELQIISTKAIADLTNYKPVLKAKQTGGKIHLSFMKHGADGMNMYGLQQGQTVGTLLGNAKQTPYIDPRPVNTPGIAEYREFYCIPTLANVEVGQRSDVISVKYTG
jgi:hypothetical protein